MQDAKLQQFNQETQQPNQSQQQQQQFYQDYQQQNAPITSQVPQQQMQQQDQAYIPASANGRSEPSMIQCPTCKTKGITRTEPNSCNIVTGLWCLGAGLFCCFIPGCCKHQTEYNHYCQTCNTHVGRKQPECC